MSASTKKKLRKEQSAAQLTEKQLAEQKEAKKLKSYTLVFAVVVLAVLIAAVVIIAVTAYNNSGIKERSTDALTVGEHTLNNAELNYYYIEAINEYYSSMTSQYGDYATMYMAMMGLDVTQPLNELPYGEDSTYADFFVDLAVQNATETLTFYDMATAAGHKLTEEEQKALDTSIENMSVYGTMYGYTDMDDYIASVYGPGSSEESYVEYMTAVTVSQSFRNAKYNELSYDSDAIEAYNKEHFDDFSSFDYSVFTAYVSDFIDCPADADDEEHQHSAEETAAAEAACKEAMEKIAASGVTTPVALNKALDSLEVYSGKNKKCTENDSILFSSITNPDIAAWLNEDGRKAGDITLLTHEITNTDADGNKTTSIQGYYIVLFEGRNDNEVNMVNVRHILKKFVGGTTDPTTGVTTYSEEDKATTLAAITEVKEQWIADGATEEAFTALVSKNTNDTASASTGGLMEDVYPGQTVEGFDDWCFDPARKAGDCEIVETEFGYHLIYFVETQDVLFRDYMIENTLRNTDFEAWYNAQVEAAEATVLNTKHLRRDIVLN